MQTNHGRESSLPPGDRVLSSTSAWTRCRFRTLVRRKEFSLSSPLSAWLLCRFLSRCGLPDSLGYRIGRDDGHAASERESTGKCGVFAETDQMVDPMRGEWIGARSVGALGL